mmetsp:Transcript_11007/g.16697  ORF Transcript_11007/g.16697 Transcript_11007/m.16697 type:complete len:207 (+) Transcript_11007:1064-1684(+)
MVRKLDEDFTLKLETTTTELTASTDAKLKSVEDIKGEMAKAEQGTNQKLGGLQKMMANSEKKMLDHVTQLNTKITEKVDEHDKQISNAKIEIADIKKKGVAIRKEGSASREITVEDKDPEAPSRKMSTGNISKISKHFVVENPTDMIMGLSRRSESLSDRGSSVSRSSKRSGHASAGKKTGANSRRSSARNLKNKGSMKILIENED